VACPRKCRRRSRVKFPSLSTKKESLLIWQPTRFRRKWTLKGPRHAGEWREGSQGLNEGSQGECSPGQQGGSCPRRNEKFCIIPTDRKNVSEISGSKGYQGTDRRRLTYAIVGCAKNLRRTRGTWASADGTVRQASLPKRRLRRKPGDPASSDFESQILR